MSITNISVCVDSTLKQDAENLFDDLGINMSTAITMFLETAVRCDGIPFEVKRQTLGEQTKSALEEYRDMKENSDKYKRYDSFGDVVKDVLKEDA